jgi:hypothetical protein
LKTVFKSKILYLFKQFVVNGNHISGSLGCHYYLIFNYRTLIHSRKIFFEFIKEMS